MKKSIDLAFRCTNCDFKSSNVKSTQQHLIECSNNQIEQEESVFECFICDYSFATEKVLSKHHLEIHGLQDDYKEPNEDVDSFKDNDDKTNQHNSEIKKESIDGKCIEVKAEKGKADTKACDMCGKSFFEDTALLDHLLNDHMSGSIDVVEEKFICDICEKVFDLEMTLKRHIKTNHTVVKSEKAEEIIVKVEPMKGDEIPETPEKIPTLLQPELKISRKEPIKTYNKKSNNITKSKKRQSRPKSKCQLCDLQFDRHVKLEEHILVQHLFKKFDCFYCKEVFDSSRSLVTHFCSALPFNETMTYFCHICPESKKYKSMKYLKNHLIDYHLRLEHNCDICGNKLNTYRAWLNHIQTLHDMKRSIHYSMTEDNEFLCKYCDRSCKTLKVWFKHFYRAHKDKASSHTCEFCEEKFFTKRSLFKHVHTEHNDHWKDFRRKKRRFAKESNAKFQTVEKYEKTLVKIDNMRDKSEPFKCQLCTSKFEKNTELEHHLVVTHLDMKFKCSFCKKEHTSFLSMKNHNCKSLLSGKVLEFECHVCSKMYTSTVHLKDHLINIHLKIGHECDICGMKISSKTNLIIHKKVMHQYKTNKTKIHKQLNTPDISKTDIAIECDDISDLDVTGNDNEEISSNPNKNNIKSKRNHAPEKEVRHQIKKCQLCLEDIKSGYWGTLKQHYLVDHLGIKFECKYCAKISPNSKRLSDHYKKAHKSKETYNCHLCPKSFKKGVKWTKHLIVDHLNVKEFECNTCDARFSENSMLKSHVGTHLMKEHLKCKICYENFSSHLQIADHLRLHKRCHFCSKPFDTNATRMKVYNHLGLCVSSFVK